MASSVIKIQQIQGEKKEITANFTKSEVEKDKLRVELAKTNHELEKCLVRNEKLKSQNQKYKEVISVLISAQDEGSEEIQFEEQDVVSTGKSLSEAPFLHQLTHNMTKDCSLNYKFNT